MSHHACGPNFKFPRGDAPLPIFVTAFSSHLPRMGSRLPRCVASRVREPLAPARMAKLFLNEHRCQSPCKPCRLASFRPISCKISH